MSNGNVTVRPRQEPVVLHNPTPTQIEAAARKSEATMPPPGHARDEALKARKDECEQKAQEIADDPNAPVYIDQAELKRKFAEEYHRYEAIVRQGSRQAEPFRGKRAEFEYCLVYAPLHMSHRPGAQAAIFESAVRLGWERVHKNDPEGIANDALIDAEGSVRIGDAILMRLPKWKHEILVQLRDQRAEERAGNAAYGTLASDLRQYEKFGRPLGKAEAAERMHAAAANGFVVSPSNAILERWMKSGTIPGISPGQ